MFQNHVRRNRVANVKKMIFEDQINVLDNPKYDPLTFRNKNVTFGQKSRVFKAKKNGRRNFT